MLSLTKQLDGDTGTDGIVYFSHSICFAKQLGNCLGTGRRLDDRTVANVPGRQANTGKLGRCLKFSTLDRYAQTRRFSIEVVAVAGCQGKHQELAAVD